MTTSNKREAAMPREPDAAMFVIKELLKAFTSPNAPTPKQWAEIRVLAAGYLAQIDAAQKKG